jgi:hypothetical protein
VCSIDRSSIAQINVLLSQKHTVSHFYKFPRDLELAASFNPKCLIQSCAAICLSPIRLTNSRASVTATVGRGRLFSPPVLNADGSERLEVDRHRRVPITLSFDGQRLESDTFHRLSAGRRARVLWSFFDGKDGRTEGALAHEAQCRQVSHFEILDRDRKLVGRRHGMRIDRHDNVSSQQPTLSVHGDIRLAGS